MIDAAIAEDQTFNDPTTAALVPPQIRGVGILRAKAAGVLAGVEVGMAVFRRVEPELELDALMADGATLAPGDDIARVAGPAGGILRAERIALNFMQRMSGIASLTNRYVRAIEGSRSRIVDTRKTAPGHRYLDKYSDNHIEANRFREMGLRQVIELALERASHTIRVEVEVETLEDAQEALDAGAHIIMLDNMPVEMMREAMGFIGDQAVVEASGGINFNTVRDVASTGVHLISIGELTHSPPALDISLDLEFE
ncbi:Probable nicotinate-nucleotide pyrophosphorylase [carboxylating] [Geodia barretti]|uniref:Nicotinate-nucleotide pyrophosphorylase [carboxylating] n=1 Tax=Geodia barretti TaxID=519541 RepID=A0AA35X5E6_GEOBA|nr:Probable nicotinate-nucleotide pyrophosphorylase [carboxylating] [Geodia barretti]